MRGKIRSKKYVIFLFLISVTILGFLIINGHMSKSAMFQTPRRYPDFLDNMDVPCEVCRHHNHDSKFLFQTIDDRTAIYQKRKQKEWSFDHDKYEKMILNSSDRCSFIRQSFSFNTIPLSQEETDYPLAYGIVAYLNIVQVLFMLSSIYHPQNEYCIAISKNSTEEFKIVMKEVNECFPNVHVMQRGNIKWASYEIIDATYACLEHLSRSQTPWRYYQYLSGFDAPLKTNLEMVRIFGWLNGSMNVELQPFPMHRYEEKKIEDAPLPLVKTSLSALVPRETADAIVNNSITSKLLEFLNGTIVPDESFWGTMTGNKKLLNIPGSFDAEEILTRTKGKKDSEEILFLHPDGYISRYQVWEASRCGGKMVKRSCVFGVANYPELLSPEQRNLVAHKFYMDTQPAAFFCVLKEVRRRARSEEVRLYENFYRHIPLVEMNKGIPLENITHPNWLLWS